MKSAYGMSDNPQSYINDTRQWVDQFVIRLGLCPFAKVPFDKDRIKFACALAEDMEQQLQAFWQEVEILLASQPDEISNTLLTLPHAAPGFLDFLDLHELAEQLLIAQDKADDIQLVGFHPQYQFAETAADDPVNYRNRSPHPMLHLLRVSEVTEAIESHPDIESIPVRNMYLMKELGNEQLINYVRKKKS